MAMESFECEVEGSIFSSKVLRKTPELLSTADIARDMAAQFEPLEVDPAALESFKINFAKQMP